MSENPLPTWDTWTSLFESIQLIITWAYSHFYEVYLWKILESVFILCIWILLSYGIHKLILYIFKRFNILSFIDKVDRKISQWVQSEAASQNKKSDSIEEKTSFSKKFKVDEVVAKSLAYYVFLLFFRLAITNFWIQDIEIFMNELVRYIPKLFIWAIIWYFGFRFSKFVYDIVKYTFGSKSKETAKLIATWIRGIIIFFTVMAVLDQVGIATEVTTSLLNGFIAMLAIAWWLAFWLWWKDVAREILESFRK